MTANDKSLFERIYSLPGENPWTCREPPGKLTELVESGKLKPCRALDVGCGEGYYSTYLASRGFEATGIDFSENAIRYARRHAKEAGVDCRFLAMDWKDLPCLGERFDFVLDWRFLHEILDLPEREKYVKTAAGVLESGGKYLSVSFSDKPNAWGNGRIRKTPEGTTLYFAPAMEMEAMFGKYFRIVEKRHFNVAGKDADTECNYFLMERS
ncbi:MAG: class I SAM-dependent methyltransferase [Candidatus Aenigmarchaeota archaeon]|nr:class I SAM-dependent methyltransferase [Candidatus Aenigmarchaeota archaeon]